MKTSDILKEAARAVERGGAGLFSATVYGSATECMACERRIRAVLPEPIGGLYDFSPIELPQKVRATILALAAAIAESEGD